MVPNEFSHRVSALSSMLLIVYLQVRQEELLKTVVLAGVGGISSYLLTLGLKHVLLFVKKRFKR